MIRKKLEELNLLSNFLFGTVITHPVYGPYVGRRMLETILRRKLGELIITPQKVYYGSDTNLHGIQLDVCLEEPDMPYEDGALTIFLYTKGKVGIPSEELRQLLAYMEDSSFENATNEFLQTLHGMVEHVKHDEEVSIRYMRMMEDEQDLLERGRRAGREEGHEEGLHQGIKAFILDNIEETVPKERMVEKLIKHFGMSENEAISCYEKYSV